MSFLSRLLTPSGTGALQAGQAGMSNIATEEGKLYNQYMPEALAGLEGLLTPGSPMYQEMNRQAGGGAQQLQAQLDARGLGKSSFAGNDLAGYWAGVQGQRNNIALNGLLQLANLASGQGAEAVGGFNNMAGAGANQVNASLQGIQQLGQFAGGVNWGNLFHMPSGGI